VRRIISKRDGDRCAFVAKTGRGCNETSCVQYHHVDPDGPATPANLELRCAGHNRYEAGVYGPTKLKYAGVVSEPRASYSVRATWFKPSSRVERPRYRAIKSLHLGIPENAARPGVGSLTK
jgi:hypothetical protein